jgi:hypothetical protein
MPEVITENNTISAGLCEKTLAIAGGIMSSEVISNTPTICTDTDTVSAIISINNS